jgi:ornithine decarboxylase
VKANPAPEILRLLARSGLQLRLRVGRRDRDGVEGGRDMRIVFPMATPSRKNGTLPAPMRLGVRCSPSTAMKKSRRSPRAAPGARVFCRVLTDGEGAEWPLSRKFGCVPQMAVDVLVYAHQLGLVSHGVSFHVGSQMTKLMPGMRPLRCPPASSTNWRSRAST